jgi:hypothetical protein
MLSDGGKYQMVSNPDHRKSMRFEQNSTVILANEHFEYFSYAQVFNFSGGGLYFKSDVAYKPGDKIQSQFDHPPFQSGPKILRSVVRWCRELTDYDSDYTYGVGVKFI